jgi:hypothetical protein
MVALLHTNTSAFVDSMTDTSQSSGAVASIGTQTQPPRKQAHRSTAVSTEGPRWPMIRAPVETPRSTNRFATIAVARSKSRQL